MQIFYWIWIVAMAFACSVWAEEIAKLKGHNSKQGLVLGLLFGPVALIALAGYPDLEDRKHQRDLLFQQVGRLERIARKAENAGQFSAAVGAITALNRMMALGADQKGFRGHPTHYYRR